jgi:hypothetical protein
MIKVGRLVVGYMTRIIEIIFLNSLCENNREYTRTRELQR